MSSTYHSTSYVDAQQSAEFVDDLGLNHPVQSEVNLLSPYNNSQTLSNSASPSYNINSTPGESLSEYSNYQPSEFSEFDDPFFGVDFDAGVQRTDSLPSNLAPQRIAVPTRPPSHPTSHQEYTSISEPRSASTYPLSPIHSSIHNTPSPRIVSNALKSQTTISHHELVTGLHNPGYQGIDPRQTQIDTSVQLTPDHSGSSNTSSEVATTGDMGRSEQSPRISISQWETMHPQNELGYFPQSGEITNIGDVSYVDTTGHSINRDENGAWRSNERTGQAGLDPDTRGHFPDVELPNLKEQAEQRRIDHINSEIEEWRSQAGGSSDAEGEEVNSSYFPSSSRIWDTRNPSHHNRQPEEDDNIAPVDDAASIRENRLVEGQVYYHFKDTAPNAFDYQLMNQSRHWSDAPAYPYITGTKYQPQSSNDAIRRWNASADTFSLSSRAATWGTRRRSEPSIADWESVADGSFLKKLAISKPKEGGRPRNNSIFDQGLDRLANFTRKRSNSKLKRARSAVNIPEDSYSSSGLRKDSQDTLAPPPHTSSFGPKPTPSLNTGLAAMAGAMAAVGTTHARSKSVSGSMNATSPKSPLQFGGVEKLARSVIKRARSRSELTTQEKSATAGIAELWRQKGGPPVPTLTHTQSEPEGKAAEYQDNEDDDDDDDDVGEEGDMKMTSEEEADPIIPNYEGFKAHVKRLNPLMESNYRWLVSRIAHQQEIRYKSLLESRVKHSQAVSARACGAGGHCVALGGTATLLDTKGNPRDSERNTPGLQLVTDFSDNDSNPTEGALTDETFPQGVPRPPTRSLPAEFECQLCFKTKKFQKPSDWTKHVHEDVQPFTCTYDKCKEPKSFKRKADWVRHENERHRHLEWWVCQVEDCKHPCYRKDNFLQHLVREHKLPEPKQKTKAAIKKARSIEPAWIMLERCHHETTKRPQDEPCKFCGKTFATWKKLTVHLAKHMEYISLPILKLVEARAVDGDTIISPVEQILTPITPVGRTKIENSPFNMNNVSPHGTIDSNFAGTNFDQRSYYSTAGPGPSYMQDQTPQVIRYNQNVYTNNYAPAFNPTRYTGMSNEPVHMSQNRNFGSIDAGFTQVKVEQNRGFGSMDAAFSNVVPNSNYQQHPQTGYSMPTNFSSAPALAGYPSSNMHAMNDGPFGFDSMATESNPGFQQVPMSRGPGSGSSFGHSPQNMPPPFYGPQ